MAANSVDPAARDIEIEPSVQQIRAHSAKILASEMFVRSDRLCRFLQLTVKRTLAADTAQISEYIVGRDVFDRDHRPATITALGCLVFMSIRASIPYNPTRALSV